MPLVRRRNVFDYSIGLKLGYVEASLALSLSYWNKYMLTLDRNYCDVLFKYSIRTLMTFTDGKNDRISWSPP